ncbi:cobalt-precorrin-5B (C(1))-methyltransferase CbiD [Treponema sp.]|uniref:cobalt-precorrin-5B (C(1))-methyltransferase CbiD n=1 Tax=Treponema sp. TaxID=166 RepID=UPI002600814A|nr:cobalt-precorrin-5B (C(1))-methyltransferase CbiD [Treponema sp.]MBR4322621.1 cobalt-precorrin-5B (C(1))-methyltransferase [Treponema sp.]
MPSPANPTKSFFLLKKAGEPEIGYTTGTCAAAASLAATRMLLTQKNVPYVTLTTPKGIKVFIEIEDAEFSETYAKCSVRKYSGTDPDVTNGINIFASVRKIERGEERGGSEKSKIVTDFQRKDSPEETFVSEGQAAGLQGKTSGCEGFHITIKGGEGVGRVTLLGLDQKPGEAAINSVPRKMILDGVRAEVEKFYGRNCDEAQAGRKIPGLCSADSTLSLSFPCPIEGLEVTISVPEGEKIAKQTFNPKLGIVGGISILGTSGIVEPMSEQALLDTIKLEINVRKSQGFRILPVVPGNYGADFLQSEFGFSVETAVHCSNFVYDTVQMAKKAGFKKMLFCGHLGKLVKVAGGIKNTHSKYGYGRMEILSQLAESLFEKGDFTGRIESCGRCGGKISTDECFSSIKNELLACISTEQAVKVLDSIDEKHEVRQKIMAELARRIQKNMLEWAGGEIETEVLVFTKEMGLLGQTQAAGKFIDEIKNAAPLWSSGEASHRL